MKNMYMLGGVHAQPSAEVVCRRMCVVCACTSACVNSFDGRLYIHECEYKCVRLSIRLCECASVFNACEYCFIRHLLPRVVCSSVYKVKLLAPTYRHMHRAPHAKDYKYYNNWNVGKYYNNSNMYNKQLYSKKITQFGLCVRLVRLSSLVPCTMSS